MVVDQPGNCVIVTESSGDVLMLQHGDLLFHDSGSQPKNFLWQRGHRLPGGNLQRAGLGHCAHCQIGQSISIHGILSDSMKNVNQIRHSYTPNSCTSKSIVCKSFSKVCVTFSSSTKAYRLISPRLGTSIMSICPAFSPKSPKDCTLSVRQRRL